MYALGLNGNKLLLIRVIDQISKLIVLNAASTIHFHLLMLSYYSSLLTHCPLSYEGTETVSGEVLCK